MTEPIKTRQLTFEEVKGLVNDYGTLKVADFPENTCIIAKIVGEVYSEEHANKDDPEEITVRHYLPIEYKDKTMAEWASIKAQIGEGAAARLATSEKFPKGSYIGLMAFISRTKFKGKFPQHITPFKNDRTPIDTNKLFAQVSATTPTKTLETQKKGIPEQPETIDTDELESLEEDTPKEELTPNEKSVILECRTLVAQKQAKDENFKELNATQWTNLLIKKGIPEARAKHIVQYYAKLLEIC